VLEGSPSNKKPHPEGRKDLGGLFRYGKRAKKPEGKTIESTQVLGKKKKQSTRGSS